MSSERVALVRLSVALFSSVDASVFSSVDARTSCLSVVWVGKTLAIDAFGPADAGFPLGPDPASRRRTKISPFSTFTSCARVGRMAGIERAAPVRMSNFAPCLGQAMV